MKDDKEILYTPNGVYVGIKDDLESIIGYMKIEEILDNLR